MENSPKDELLSCGLRTTTSQNLYLTRCSQLMLSLEVWMLGPNEDRYMRSPFVWSHKALMPCWAQGLPLFLHHNTILKVTLLSMHL